MGDTNTNRQKNTTLFIGIILTSAMGIFVLTGFFWTPYHPETMDVSANLAGISWQHIFGCDHLGRDILSRVMQGSGTTFIIALVTVLVGSLAGILLGAVTGYFGGWLDEIIMGINNVLFAFPSILLALVVISLLGSGKYNVMIALGISFVPSFARIVRSEFIRCKNLEYVKSARLYGASHVRIMFLHILPNTLSSLLPSIVIGFNNAVLAESSMSFLGIGVQPPDASLGRMLSEAQAYLYSAPGYAIFPGLILILMVLGFSLLVEGWKGKHIC